MKSKHLLKMICTLFIALVMLVLTPMQIFAANFNVTKQTLKDNSWWTPKIGINYVAGTTNASCAYYHYCPTDNTGAYDFIVYSNTKTPMSGAVYTKSSKYIWWTPIQLAYKDSAKSNSGITMHVDMVENKEYWFALGGQPNCSGTYYFSVKPHQDFNTAYYYNLGFHGKIWTRTTPHYCDYNRESVNEIVFLSPYEANVVYSYLTEDLLYKIKEYFDDGWSTWDSIENALNAIGFGMGLITMVVEIPWLEVVSIIYSVVTSLAGDVLGLMRGGDDIEDILDLRDELEEAGEISYYWSEDGNYCHKFNNWVKIESYSYASFYYSDPDSPRLDWYEVDDVRVESIEPLLFYGPEYAEGTWSNVKTH